MTNTDRATELCAKKHPLATKEYDRAKRALSMLQDLAKHVPPEDQSTFKLSFLNPAKRRLQKASLAVVFWSDPADVEDWLAKMEQGRL